MTQALASEQTVAQITGLLLTLSDRLLLVPNTAVAELVAYRNVQPAENLTQLAAGTNCLA